jgi:ABC-type branched-subunit amino acid transport system substrate-binding protein
MQNTFLRQMQDNRIALPLFGTDTFETPSESVGVEELAKGAVYANAMVDKNFEDRYRARFANTSQIVHAALAYEFARTVTLLFSTQNSRPSTSDILRKFSNVQSRNGVLGLYSFSNDMEVGQHFKFRLSVKQAALPPPGTPLRQGLCPAQAHC